MKITRSLTRICLGFIFLWAFLDKVFGLGFATKPGQSWLNGVSPTVGFLSHATRGPLAGLYQALAGNGIVDWLFMTGLLLMGLCLVLGIGLRIACYSGVVLMVLLWSAALLPSNNPLVDEHVIYALVLVWLSHTDTTKQLGLGKWWVKLPLVQRYPILR